MARRQAQPTGAALLPKDPLLLHSCCAPCAGVIMEDLVQHQVPYTILFYNPNIHPQREYNLRKAENMRHAQSLGVPFVDADYDVANWMARVKGLENEPERGARCTACFDMRFAFSALYAHEHGFKGFATTLGISRWKDLAQVNGSGARAALRYENLTFWAINWRKGGGSARMIELSKKEGFYQQEYCGCIYSLRDTNAWRLARGRERIRLGEQYYGADRPRPDADSSDASCSVTQKLPET